MNWDRYKALCDSPEVCSRWMLEQTLELLGDEALRERLQAVMGGAPLEKPLGHRGGAATDMFVVSLTLAEAHGVLEAVEAAVARGATSSATRARGLGGFGEAWREYVQHLRRQRPDPGRDCSPRS
jgi:hypothetical protein